MQRPRPRLLAFSILVFVQAVAAAAELNCIALTQLNSSAPAGVRACCRDDWYTSYSGISGSVPVGTKHTYCGTPTNRALDYQLARSNTSWYEYCLQAACPLDEGQACCATDVPAANSTTLQAASPSPLPSPGRSPSGDTVVDMLYPQEGVIWAVYMCPRTPPSTSLFGYALAPPTEAPATATAKAAPLNLTTAPASKLLAACPSVPEGTEAPALDATFNFTVGQRWTDIKEPDDGSYIGIVSGVAHMLSFFRKPSLGAVKITLSVRVDDDQQPDAVIHDHITITLDAPSPSVVASVPTNATKGNRTAGSGRRLLAVGDLDEAARMAPGARRRLQRGGGGGGFGKRPGRSRGKRSSGPRTLTNYLGGSTGRRPYRNETLNTEELYTGRSYMGVYFLQHYRFREGSTPFLSSKRWEYVGKFSEESEVPYAVPGFYRNSYVVNSSVVNTTYGFYGPSVFPAKSTFQYVSNSQWPAPKGAPICSACLDMQSCCSGGLSCCEGPGNASFANEPWSNTKYYPNRRATLLSCGLIQDFVTTLPIYLPSNATSLRITIHSVEATATTAAPACGDTAATLDPREPPFYLTVIRADEVAYVYEQDKAPPKGSVKSRSSSAAAAPPALPLAVWGLLLAVCLLL